MLRFDFPFQNEKGQIAELFQELYGIEIIPEIRIGQIEHVFSHLIWNISVYSGRLMTPANERPEWKLVTLEEMENLAFPVPHQKMRKLYQDAEQEPDSAE